MRGRSVRASNAMASVDGAKSGVLVHIPNNSARTRAPSRCSKRTRDLSGNRRASARGNEGISIPDPSRSTPDPPGRRLNAFWPGGTRRDWISQYSAAELLPIFHTAATVRQGTATPRHLRCIDVPGYDVRRDATNSAEQRPAAAPRQLRCVDVSGHDAARDATNSAGPRQQAASGPSGCRNKARRQFDGPSNERPHAGRLYVMRSTILGCRRGFGGTSAQKGK